MDFTINIYKKLLKALVLDGYSFQTLEDFHRDEKSATIILRHDVDKRPKNSLRFAKIEYDFGIKGSYYFRAVPESWDEKIVLEIHKMGHEIGYHYENLTTCNGNMDDAYRDFCKKLEEFRKIVPIKTICMHGSPLSRFDSRDLWKKYDYKSLGIIAEPYFDINFGRVLYLSDTGRRWDGYNVSVRDKIPMHQERWNKEGLMFHTTHDIIRNMDKLPNIILFTFHPQRWHNLNFVWIKELIYQNLKNQIKSLKIKLSNKTNL